MSDDPYAGWALIVVDVQQGFDDPAWGERNNPACDDNIAALIDDWSSHDRPLVYVRHDSLEDESRLDPRHSRETSCATISARPSPTWWCRSTSTRHSTAAPTCTRGCSAEQAAGIVVCGITTNHCCETTVRVGANLGHDVLFPIDATFTHDRRHPDGATLSADELTRATAASLHDEFANVTTTAGDPRRSRPADRLSAGPTSRGQPTRAKRAVIPLGRDRPAGHHGGMAEHAEHEVKVLVVDDQDPFRRAMAAVVEATDGFVVLGAVASGEESIEAVRVMQPDLVLMDVNLPGMSGVDATRVISALESGPVVVLLSTYDEDEFDQAGCGAAAYVAKALFSPDRLEQVWQSAVAAH